LLIRVILGRGGSGSHSEATQACCSSKKSLMFAENILSEGNFSAH